MSHTFCSMSEGLVFQVLRSPHTPNHLFCCLSRFPSVFFFSIALLHFLFSYVFLSSLAPFLSLRSALWDMLLIFHLEWRRAVQRHCNINSFLPSLASVWLTRCTKPPQLFNSFYYSTPIRGFFPVNLVLICHTASIKQPPGWWSFWLFSFFLLVSFLLLAPLNSSTLYMLSFGRGGSMASFLRSVVWCSAMGWAAVWSHTRSKTHGCA